MRVPVAASLLALGGCSPMEAPGPIEDSATRDVALSFVHELQKADVGPVGELTTGRTQESQYGTTTVRIHQFINDLPILGAEAILVIDAFDEPVFTRDELVYGSDAHAYEKLTESSAKLTKADAIDAALKRAGLVPKELTADPDVTMVGVPQEGTVHPAWRVALQVFRGSEHTTAPLYFVDALTGEILYEANSVIAFTDNFKGLTQYDGYQTFTGYEDANGVGYTEIKGLLGTFDMGGTTYPNGLSYTMVSSATPPYFLGADHPSAVSLHWGGQRTWEWYLNNLGINGPDGMGGPDCGPSTSSPGNQVHALGYNYGVGFRGAIYLDNITNCTVYGEGDGVSIRPAVSIDAAAHELTHAYLDELMNLFYGGEGAAMSEAISDFMAAIIQAQVERTYADAWTIGEDLLIGTADPMRRLDKPTAIASPQSYSCYHDVYWPFVPTFTKYHSAGTVVGHALYLMSMGGDTDGYPTTNTTLAIGPDVTAKILWHAIDKYMTRMDQMVHMHKAMVAAATDLYGLGSPEALTADGAFRAVGINSAQCGGVM